MKTVLNYVTVAAFLLVSTAGIANGTVNALDKKGKAKSEVEKSLISIELDPVFIKKGDKILMNLLNISQGEVILKVYDSEARLVYSESIEGELVVEKAFNFEKAFEDEYTVVVVDKMGTYKKTIEVR
ncbi:hypothetical protein LV716_01955 [Flagellimonas sp. HMM57]|uniref:hypothetical protein n=1 Tax=unclassified Flagellimonas TaxID=2644544 RepID=UPI0013D878CC|nr:MULTISPECIES: hypothetical protein [unclassified Flagellimonas]MBS9462695.1 hypothetical protein [Flagellimonas sp. 389]UII76578.1 hypothetical protein LV716_01955 [Flagellimonas sp. HMM57]